MRFTNRNILAGIIMGTAFIFCIGAQAASDPGSFILMIFYDHGKLSSENYPTESLTVSSENFVLPSSKPYKFFSAELYDVTGGLLTKSLVDQKNQLNEFSEYEPEYLDREEGEVRIILPFSKTAEKLIIKDDKGAVVLDWKLRPENFCNRNNICEPQLNESENTCATDCAPSATIIPVETISPSPSNIPESRSKLKIFLPLLIWFGAAIGLIAAYVIIKRRSQGSY